MVWCIILTLHASCYPAIVWSQIAHYQLLAELDFKSVLVESKTSCTFSIYDFYRRVGAGSEDPLRACSIVKKQAKRNINAVSKLRKAALDHMRYVKSTTMYPLEHSPRHGLLCTVPSAKWLNRTEILCDQFLLSGNIWPGLPFKIFC